VVLAEHRPECSVCAAPVLTNSLIYAGDCPLRIAYISVQSLYWTQYQTGSHYFHYYYTTTTTDGVQVAPPVLDMFGRVVSDAAPDPYAGRCGVALALSQMAPLLTDDHVTRLFQFFVTQSLNDRHASVRANMLTAAVTIINHHGKVCNSCWYLCSSSDSCSSIISTGVGSNSCSNTERVGFVAGISALLFYALALLIG